MKSKKMVIAAATLAMIAAASVGPAMAYFTATDSASGLAYVNLGDTELTPNEEFDDTAKTVKVITVENTGSYDVWVRVKVFSAVGITPVLGERWSEADSEGYYVYKDVVKAGETTDAIKFKVNLPTEGVTEASQPEYNVIIVEEATRALYDEKGNPDRDEIKWERAVKAEQVKAIVADEPETLEGGNE